MVKRGRDGAPIVVRLVVKWHAVAVDILPQAVPGAVQDVGGIAGEISTAGRWRRTRSRDRAAGGDAVADEAIAASRAAAAASGLILDARRIVDP